MLTVIFSTMVYAEGAVDDIEPDFRLGAGIGIPYGGVGVNLETALVKYVAVAVGLGLNKTGAGWSLGARLYPFGREVRLSPRIAAYHGIIGIIEKPGSEDAKKSGNAYGAGFDWNLNRGALSRKDSIDFEVLYVEYDIPPGYELKGEDIKFSIGYRFRF